MGQPRSTPKTPIKARPRSPSGLTERDLIEGTRSRLIDKEWDARAHLLAVASVIATTVTKAAEIAPWHIPDLQAAYTAYKDAQDARFEFERRLRY